VRVARGRLVLRLGIGDAVLLSLARDGIGHVALLRQPGDVPVLPEPLPDGERDAPLDPLAEDVDSSDATRGSDVPAGAALDAADLELALRYLPEYAVVVVAETLDAAALRAVVDAAGWAGARLVIASGGADPVNVPDDATLLEPPAVDREGAFAALVGRYAAALDRGEPPEAAFETASTAAGWTPVAG